MPKSVKTSFPVDLEKPEVGTLIAAALGNGSYLSSGRFTYKNTEKEMVEKLKETVRSLIGDAKIEEKVEEEYKKQILKVLEERDVLISRGRNYVITTPYERVRLSRGYY